MNNATHRKYGQRSLAGAGGSIQPTSFFGLPDANPPMESVCFICNVNYWSTLDPTGSCQMSAARLLLFCDLFGLRDDPGRAELLALSILTEPFCSGCAHKIKQIQEWMLQLDFIQKGIQNLKAEVAQLMLQSLPHSVNFRGTYPIKARIVRLCTSSNEILQDFNGTRLPTSQSNTGQTSQNEWESNGDDDEDEEESVGADDIFGDKQDDDDDDFNPVESLVKSLPRKKGETVQSKEGGTGDTSKQPRQRRLRLGGERIEAHEDGRCRLCPSTFKSKIQLWKHIRRAHSGISYQCHYCEKVFKDTSNRKRHEELHLITTREFVCEECGKDYKTKTDLNVHIKVVHKGYIVPKLRKVESLCQDCGRVFGNAARLRVHQKMQHSNLQPKPCPICGRPVKGPTAMHSHKKTHISAWELKELKGFTYHWKCPICPLEGQLGYRSRDDLREHYAQDHPDGEIKLLRVALKKAPARKNKRTYFCAECPHLGGFYWKTMLDAHVASGHQEFLVGRLGMNCRVCKKRCNKRETARRHEETHHPQVHVCSICFFIHTKKKEMETHYIEDHPEVLIPELPPLNKLEDVSDGSDESAEGEDLGEGIKEEERDSSGEDSDLDYSSVNNVASLRRPRFSRRGRLINPSKHLDVDRCEAAGITQELRIKLEKIDEIYKYEHEDAEEFSML